MTYLVDLKLNENIMTGTLPEQYSTMAHHDYKQDQLFVDIHGNQFSGTLPSCWSTMTRTNQMYTPSWHPSLPPAPNENWLFIINCCAQELCVVVHV